MELEKLLVYQVKQLGKMETLETRRLAILTGDKPETALALQKESDQVFDLSVALQEKIDTLLAKIDRNELSPEKQKKIASLTKLVRKLARRNYELNQQCQQVLGKLLSGISDQIAGIKKGRRVVRSYHKPNAGGNSTISGQF
jgi:hypothetical protein